MTESQATMERILIVGGTSGLGLELARKYQALGHTVLVAGRKDPKIAGIEFVPLSMSHPIEVVRENLDAVVAQAGPINTLIYAAGFYQEGHIDELPDEAIIEMVNVGLLVPALLVQRFRNSPGKPLKVMLVTSSSQYTPREGEPMYTTVKSGLGMLGASLSLDPGFGKVLVVAPSGMKTPFWDEKKDVSDYLDPAWVADQIIELSSGPFKYRFAKILRGPARVEITETRTE